MSAMSWAFDAVLAIALIGAGALAWRLDRRLAALRSGQDGVRDSVAELVAATLRAEASVRALRAAGEGLGAELEAEIARGRQLVEDLRRLNQTPRAVPASAPVSPALAQAPTQGQADAQSATPSLRELIDALKSVR